MCYRYFVLLVDGIYQTPKLRNSQSIPLPSPLGEGLGVRPVWAGGEAFFSLTPASSPLQPYFLAPLIGVQQTVAGVGA